MADTETATPAAPQSKAAFVRSLPMDMPAGEVVVKAKAAGITITNGHVHSIRSEVKAARKKKRAAKKGAKAPAAKAPATKKSAAPTKALAKPVAPKTKGKRRNRPNPKKDFIAAQPATMPAMEVVAAAKKVGLVLSKQYVYQMRSKPRGSKPAAAVPAATTTAATALVKRKGGRPKGSKTKAKTVTAAPISVAATAAPAASRPSGASDMHRGLAQYVMTHGAQRVREALAEVEAGLSRVFGTT